MYSRFLEDLHRSLVDLRADTLVLEALGNQGIFSNFVVHPPVGSPLLLKTWVVEVLAIKFWPPSIISTHMASGPEYYQIAFYSRRPDVGSR